MSHQLRQEILLSGWKRSGLFTFSPILLRPTAIVRCWWRCLWLWWWLFLASLHVKHAPGAPKVTRWSPASLRLVLPIRPPRLSRRFSMDRLFREWNKPSKGTCTFFPFFSFPDFFGREGGEGIFILQTRARPSPFGLWTRQTEARCIQVCPKNIFPPQPHHVHSIFVQFVYSEVAMWADDVKRDPKYSWSSPLHFVDTEDRACVYNYKWAN